MAHELSQGAEIELGVASLDTLGPIAPDVEDTFGLPAAGLSDD